MSPLSIDVWIYILTAYLAVSLILYTISRLYTVKKVTEFPVRSRDVTNQTLPVRE
jgi:hypothetical protein